MKQRKHSKIVAYRLYTFRNIIPFYKNGENTKTGKNISETLKYSREHKSTSWLVETKDAVCSIMILLKSRNQAKFAQLLSEAVRFKLIVFRFDII